MSEKLLQKIVKRISDKPSWLVRRLFGSTISFEFGKPKLCISETVYKPNKKAGSKHPRRLAYVSGGWHLEIFCCDWEIRQADKKIGDSKSIEKIDRGCSVLNGQILTKVAANPKTRQTDFYFDLGGHLRAKPYKIEDEPSEMWSIRSNNGFFFIFRSDGKYSYQRGDTAPQELRWLAFTV